MENLYKVSYREAINNSFTSPAYYTARNQDYLKDSARDLARQANDGRDVLFLVEINSNYYFLLFGE